MALKKRMTQEQEFKIMTLVLDKFLWVGVFIMVYGFYVVAIANQTEVLRGVAFMIAGALILLLFMFLIVREYEVMK
ncbi:hypothetical protein HZB01_02320 [Candidatus Woesearchaeota archaeon]|nr:hypothetical protein [Candidatus Woesearchaeota archaeon]